MSERQEFLEKLKQEAKKHVPSWISGFINVESVIEQNVEVLIEWLRNNRKLILKILK